MKRYFTIIMVVMIISLSTVQPVGASGVPAVDDQRLVVTIDGNPVDFSFLSLNEFLKHLNVHNLNEIPLSDQKIPYFIETRDGKIKSITEELRYTI